MDINEQKNLATSYNLYSETTKELIQNLQGSIKYKCGIYLKSEEYKDKLMYEWFETEFDSLVSQGMEEEKAEVQAYDYAEELWNRTASSIQNVPPHHIWTIEKEIDDVVCKCILQINKNECLDIKLFTFDAKDSSLEEYKSLLNTIESTKYKNCFKN